MATNIRAEIKSILEEAYSEPPRAQTINKIMMVIGNAIAEARREAQDEQARAMFGAMTVDGDISDAG